MSEFRKSNTYDGAGNPIGSLKGALNIHNGCFIVSSPGNKPISCMLQSLKDYTDVFTIVN